MENQRSELQQHRANAVEKNSQTTDPNQKEGGNSRRFRNCWCTNGHTPSWCRKKIRHEELKRIENERTAEKKSPLLQTITETEQHTMDQKNRLVVKFFREGTRTTRRTYLLGTLHQLIRNSLLT